MAGPCGDSSGTSLAGGFVSQFCAIQILILRVSSYLFNIVHQMPPVLTAVRDYSTGKIRNMVFFRIGEITNSISEKK